MDLDQNLALTSCDKEPVHIPGAIQPFGVLLALNENLEVIQYSLNTQDTLGIPLDKSIPAPLSKWLTPESFQALQEHVLEQDFDGVEPFIAQFVSNTQKRHWNGFLHRYRGQLILELEDIDPERHLSDSELSLMCRKAISRIQSATSVQSLCEITAQEIKNISGFDGVMIYFFHPDLHGEVIAEAKSEGFSKYIGHHYPASDIPAPARAIFLQNWLRMIPSREYTPVALQPALNPMTKAPLDLGKSMLRSVSPIHIEYLRNMGVEASMTISLIKEASLWGLIACHNYSSPKYIRHEIRSACEMLGRLVSAQLPFIETKEHLKARGILKKQISSIQERLQSNLSIENVLTEESPNLLDLIPGTSGAAVCVHSDWKTLGQTATSTEISDLVDWLNDTYPNASIVHTQSLSKLYPPATNYQSKSCGLLAIRVPKNSSSWVMWFKPEKVRTITWAGSPQKSVVIQDNERRLHPRASFEEWKETVRYESLPWSSLDFEAASELLRVITAEDLRRQFKLEEEARAKAERATRQIEELMRVISHDLKTPLASFRLNLTVLDRSLKKKAITDFSELIKQMDKGATNMGALIDDILTLAKSENGMMDLELNEENPNDLLNDVLDVVQPLARQKQIALEVLPLQKQALIPCDRARVRQVLLNLLSNAIKFTPQKGKITILVTERDADDLFTIKDSGPGIAPDDLPHVFDRFWQADSHKRKGTGLGLTIAKTVVEAHGGKIWVNSREGSGSSFFFTLPKSPLT